MLTKIIETLAAAFAKREKLNTAQRLVQSWCEPLPKYQPTKPHLLFVVVDTDGQHTTREDVPVERYLKGGQKRVPVMLKYAMPVDRRRVYPYASVRQNTRLARRRAAAAGLSLAA